MKKVFAIILFTAFVINSSIMVFADSYTRIDDLNMTINIPDSYSVFTRDMNPDDPLFNKFGYNKNDMDNMFSSYNMFLDAIAYDNTGEFVVTASNKSFDDFSTASDSIIKMLVKSIFANYKEKNGVYNGEKINIVKTKQTKFASYELIYDSSYEMYGRQYVTCNDGKCIFISFHEKLLIDTDKIKEMDSIVQSIVFDSVKSVTTSQESQSFTFTDSKSCCTFTVPSGWKQDDFLTDQKFYSNKFINEKEAGSLFLFGSNDLYNKMLESDDIKQSIKSSLSREDFNMNLFTESDFSEYFSELYGVSASSITELYYGKNRFIKFESNVEKTELGFSVLVDSISFVTIVNGWQYTFMFSGDEEDYLFQEFESVLKSFEITNAHIQTTDHLNNSIIKSHFGRISNLIIIIGILVIIIGILALCVFIYMIISKNIRKKNQSIQDNISIKTDLSTVSRRTKTQTSDNTKKQ